MYLVNTGAKVVTNCLRAIQSAQTMIEDKCVSKMFYMFGERKAGEGGRGEGNTRRGGAIDLLSAKVSAQLSFECMQSAQTDSRAALQALTSDAPQTCLSVRKLQEDLQKLPHNNVVVLQWIPAHCGIQGN